MGNQKVCSFKLYNSLDSVQISFHELLKGLRKDTCYEVVDEFFSLGSHLKQRDAKSVRRIVSGTLSFFIQMVTLPRKMLKNI